MKSNISFLARIAFCVVCGSFSLREIVLLATLNSATAQVAEDGTTNTTVDADGNDFTITDGDKAGSNLFHSFDSFSVPNGGEAFFNNTADIANIFSRVTGGNISNINGLIRANDANLFLINPAGILFGAGARLDLGGGSFYGSSADSILFEDGEFSATDLENPPLLTVNAPIGLSFRDEPGSIATEAGAELAVDSSQALALIGGEIDLNGTSLNAGKITLGGLSASGIVDINNDLSFSFTDNISLANVFLSNGSGLGVGAPDEGFISINANNISMDGGFLFAGTNNEINITADNNITFNNGAFINSEVSGTEGNNAGDINFEAQGDIIFDGGSQAVNQIGKDAEGSGGNINIVANNLNFDNGSQLETNNNGNGNAGNINLTSDNLKLNNDSQLSTQTSSNGNAGNIFINNSNDIILDGSKIINQINTGAVGSAGITEIGTNNLNLSNGAELLSQIDGTGDTGNIEINASGNIIFSKSNIINQVNANGVGNAGNIEINANNLEATGDFETRSLFISKTAGIGDAGNVNLNIEEALDFETSTIFSQVVGQGVGRSGDIIVEAGSLNLKNNSLWLASTEAQGDAGDISIDVAGDINLDSDNLILSQVLTGGEGDAGDISITAGGSLNSLNSFIISDSKDKGDGGNITIDVGDTITLEGVPVQAGFDNVEKFPSAIITGLDEDRTQGDRELISAAEGEAGSINISARQLIMKDLAFIINNTEDNTIGDAGDININVDNLIIQDNAFISAFTENSFDGGFININAQTLDLIRGGKIITATDGDGNAGNINLNITDSIAIDGSGTPSATIEDLFVDEPFIDELQGQTGLFADATQDAGGDGGNITIGVGEIESIRDSDEFIFNPTQPTNEVSVSDRGIITAESLGTGSGGQIFIRAGDLTLANEGIISVSTDPSENTANNDTTPNKITLRIDDELTLSNNSTISAQAFQNADGGNIDIDAKFVIAKTANGNGNDIIASAEDGMGGNIDIQTEQIFNLAERQATPNNVTNDIDVSSQFGVDGNVSITILDTDSIQSVTELPTGVIEAEQVAEQACSAGKPVATNTNSFTIKGRGGVSPTPVDPLVIDVVLTQNSSNSPTNEAELNTQKNITPIDLGDRTIFPARGVIVKDNGEVILTPYPTASNDSRLPHTSSNCKTS